MSAQLALCWDLAQAGMDKASEAESEEWKHNADMAIALLAMRGAPFVADDVRAIVGDPARPNAFGGRFNAASRQGLIRKVGFRASERPSLHAHPVAVWVGVLDA